MLIFATISKFIVLYKLFKTLKNYEENFYFRIRTRMCNRS